MPSQGRGHKDGNEIGTMTLYQRIRRRLLPYLFQRHHHPRGPSRYMDERDLLRALLYGTVRPIKGPIEKRPASSIPLCGAQNRRSQLGLFTGLSTELTRSALQQVAGAAGPTSDTRLAAAF